MNINPPDWSSFKQAYRLEVEHPETKEWLHLLDRWQNNVYYVDKQEAERYAKHILKNGIQHRIVLVVF